MIIYCRVNDTEYDGDIVVEAVNYYTNGPAVPPWEEWGHPGLEGPFTTREQARDALYDEADSDHSIGVYFMPERDCPHFD